MPTRVYGGRSRTVGRVQENSYQYDRTNGDDVVAGRGVVSPVSQRIGALRSAIRRGANFPPWRAAKNPVDLHNAIIYALPMSDASTDLAAIDANLLKGEWWLCVLDELIQIGFAMTHGLLHRVNGGGESLGDRCVSVVRDFCRFAGAVHRAIALSQRLERALLSLRALRACPAEEIAAARAKAEIEAEKLAARRDRACEAAEARRAARDEDLRNEDGAKKDIEARVTAIAGREAVSVSVERAYVDIDTLELRRLVERLCADLRITPPWDRWQAEAWLPPTPGVEAVDPPGELSPSHPHSSVPGGPPGDHRQGRADDGLWRGAGIATLAPPRPRLK